MYRVLIRLLVLILCSLPAFVTAATTQSIHVEWGYTPPSEPAVTGFKLYQEGAFACQTPDAAATAMDCQVALTAETTNFTLTATFNDGTESPHSAPFAFTTPTSGETTPPPSTEPPTQPTGSKLFTFSWQSTADPASLQGYRIYLNNSLLCETTTPTATTLACHADLIKGVMTFSMTQVATTGTESASSNLLVFDPTAYPELFNTKLVTFTWEYSGTTDVSGFRFYQNNVLICQTTDHTVRELGCTVEISSNPVTYGMTAVYADGTASNPSNLLTYNSVTSGGDTSGDAPLLAIIVANTVSGPAPLAVAFNASTSTGDISTYQWDFGDGSVASGVSASHTYAIAGAYIAKLTLTSSSGQTSSATVTVTASQTTTPPPPPKTPPSAVISSSAAAGAAPLAVNFDGSGSTANNATITSHAWSFGDGSSATGASTAHTFASAGTFSTTLTVTDSNGLTATASTPVVVTAPVSTNNAPTAAISATPVSGTVPLTVTFNGGGSTDSDGSISSFVWNFGDGSSATGPTATHTYTTAASFTATLQVTDNQGAKGTASATITAQTEEQKPALNMEMAEISVSDQWVRVPLQSTFANPIVVAGPPAFANAEPCVIRLRNVSNTGFDIRLTEWNYLNGPHPAEVISYLVMEKGRHALPDGSSVEAGSFTGTTSIKTVKFSKALAKTPIVLTTVASMNEADTISGRIKTVTTTGFAYYFREQEKNTNTHVNETVNFIAWEPGKGTVGQVQFVAAATAKAVTNTWYKAAFPSSFTQSPLVLADMQTTANTDTSALRQQQLTATGFQVKVEEEQSKDSEVTHPAETVGYLAISQVEVKALATFTWEFDSAQEASINGFEIQANGETICISSNPTARKLSCEISQPYGQTAFTILAVEISGSTSSVSNSLTYTP